METTYHIVSQFLLDLFIEQFFFIDNVNKDTEKIYTIIKPMDNSEEDEDIV